MALNTLNVFEHTIEITHIWLNDLAARLHWEEDRHRAYKALRAVLHALRDRLSVDEAAHLAAQLPLLVRGIYYEGYHPAGKPLKERKKAEFLAHVGEEIPEEARRLEDLTRAVFQILEDHISLGEAEKVKGSLPAEIRALWPQAGDE